MPGLRDHRFHALEHLYESPVLDFGAGTCRFARFLQRRGFDVTAVDVVDASTVDSVRPVVLEPGPLPFADGQFQTTLCHFVLHHLPDQEGALREMIRVTSGHLILGEDVVDTPWDQAWALGHGLSSAWTTGWPRFRRTEGWVDLVERLGGRTVRVDHVPRSIVRYHPVRRAFLVFDVSAAPGPET